MDQCKICQKTTKSIPHHVKAHNITIQEYYDLYYRTSSDGYCLVCNKQTTFYGMTKGYVQYCSNSCSEHSEFKIRRQQQTCLERYGVVNPRQSKEIHKKIQKTCLERYGNESYSRTPEYKEKYTQTCLEKYGESSYCKTDDFKNKKKQTLLHHYGVGNYSQSDEYINRKDSISKRKYLTMKKNNSFTISKPEKELGVYLRSIFSEVNTQYKSDAYPFSCDFYIPELDLYIELQASWTHGTEPFIGSEEQLNILSFWKEKAENSTYYKNAIITWTEKDVLKREHAKINKLKYLELFMFDIDTLTFDTFY